MTRPFFGLQRSLARRRIAALAYALPLSLAACDSLFGISEREYAPAVPDGGADALDAPAVDAVEASTDTSSPSDAAPDASPEDSATDGESEGPLPPTLYSRVAGYEWRQVGAKQVAFVGVDGHVHELSTALGDASWAWRTQDLTVASSAPAPENGYLDAFVSEGSRGKHVLFANAGEIHDLSASSASPFGWTHANLSAIAGAPSASWWSVRGYASTPDDVRVVFATDDGHVHLLSSDAPPNDAWTHADLTSITGAPAAAPYTFLDAYATAPQGVPLNTEQIVYRSSDGHIHELSRLVEASADAGDSWVHSDLTSLAGAPLAAGRRVRGYVFNAINLKQVVYVGADRHVHELSADATHASTWMAVDLTSETGVAETDASFIDAFACEECPGKHVVYETAAGDVADLYSGSATSYKWSSADLSKGADAPAARPDSYVSGFDWATPHATNSVVYTSTAGHVHELWSPVTSSTWYEGDLTLMTGAPPVK